MFWKLLKHEFRAVGPMVLLTWAAVVGFTALSSLFGLLSRDIDELFLIPMMITTGISALVAFAAVIIVYVLIIRRFYVNIYGDEGYLTLTLPVTRGSIIWSKLICAIIFMIGTILIVCGSVLLRSSVISTDIVEGAIDMLSIIANRIVSFTGTPVWVASTELFFIMATSLVKSILVFYAAISLGQFFTGHRLLGSVLGYLGLNVVGRALNSGYMFIMGLSQKGIEILEQFYYGYSLDSLTGFEVQVSIILYIVLIALEAAMLWILTDLIMRKAVNLQ